MLKKIILVSLIPLSLLAQENETEKFCAARTKMDFYSIFFWEQTLKQKLTVPYRRIDQDIALTLKDVCDKKLPIKDVLFKAADTCYYSCAAQAKGQPQKIGAEFMSECTSLCAALENTHKGYVLGLRNKTNASNIEKFCADKAGLKVYDLYAISTIVKFRYPDLYKTVDAQVSKVLDNACEKKHSLRDTLADASWACLLTCDREVEKYNPKKFLGKKATGQAMFNECASLCSSMNHGNKAYAMALPEERENSPRENNCRQNSDVETIKSLATQAELLFRAHILSR